MMAAFTRSTCRYSQSPLLPRARSAARSSTARSNVSMRTISVSIESLLLRAGEEVGPELRIGAPGLLEELEVELAPVENEVGLGRRDAPVEERLADENAVERLGRGEGLLVERLPAGHLPVVDPGA